MLIAITYANDGSAISQKERRGLIKLGTRYDATFWWRDHEKKSQKRPFSHNLPYPFAHHGKAVVGHGSNAEKGLLSKPTDITDMAVSLVNEIRELIGKLTPEDVHNELMSAKNEMDFRPALFTREIETNPFGNMNGFDTNFSNDEAGDAAFMAGKDGKIADKCQALLKPFANFVKEHPNKIKNPDTLEVCSDWNGLSFDIELAITASRSEAMGLLHYEEKRVFERLERSGKKKPLPEADHLSWWHLQWRDRGPKRPSHFIAQCRYDLSKAIVQGVEFNFKTRQGKHYLTLHPVYNWQKAWDFDQPNGAGGSSKLYDVSGKPIKEEG